MQTSTLVLLSLVAAVTGSSDAVQNICSQACVKIIIPKQNMTNEEEEQFNVASNNGYKCAAKCQEIFSADDSESSVVSKLRKIPFNDIYRTNSDVSAVLVLDAAVRQLTARVERLEKLIFRSAIKEPEHRTSFLELEKIIDQRKALYEKNTTITKPTTKAVAASSNQNGHPQTQHSPGAGGPQIVSFPAQNPPSPLFQKLAKDAPAVASVSPTVKKY